MSPIWIEILLGFGVPIAWGVWQLIDLRREHARDAAKAAAAQAVVDATGDVKQAPPGA